LQPAKGLLLGAWLRSLIFDCAKQTFVKKTAIIIIFGRINMGSKPIKNKTSVRLFYFTFRENR